MVSYSIRVLTFWQVPGSSELKEAFVIYGYAFLLSAAFADSVLDCFFTLAIFMHVEISLLLGTR